jgi:hypothetical protein
MEDSNAPVLGEAGTTRDAAAYQATVCFSPCATSQAGSYPNELRARSMSASECGISPARAGWRR